MIGGRWNYGETLVISALGKLTEAKVIGDYRLLDGFRGVVLQDPKTQLVYCKPLSAFVGPRPDRPPPKLAEPEKIQGV